MPASTRLGRITLRVGDLDRLLPFYEDVLGFVADRDGDTAVLSAGETPLVVLDGDPNAPSRPPDATGLFHLAVRVPTRAELGDVLTRIDRSDESLTGASDHLVSEALYLRDPEGNGIEVYRDRPREAWRFTGGGDRVEMDTLRLDLDDLRSVATGAHAEQLSGETDLGHVHLEVSSLGESKAFYVDTLGLNVRTESYQGALFVACGDYHHHVGLNTWNGRQASVGTHRGIEWFEFVVPDDGTIDALSDSLDSAAVEHHRDGTRLRVTDPDGIEVRVRSAA
jgi:catechol 2,3-dioxygenase